MVRPPVVPPNSLTPEELAKRILSTPKMPRKPKDEKTV